MNQEILKQNFENHGFKTAFFSTAKEAADYLSARIRRDQRFDRRQTLR